jgi:NTE family protein
VLDILSKTKFSSFEDKKKGVRILFSYGLYKGQELFEWIQGLVKGSPLGLAEDATFADLKAKGVLDLYVFSTNLNLQTTPEFSADKSPDVQIAEAVRASMSIPIFFKAWRFSNDNPNDHVHVDGGVQYVFPLSIFDDSRFNADADADSYNEESLGLYLDNGGKAPVDNGLGCGEPELYVKTLFTSLLQGQDGLFKPHTSADRQLG